MIERIENEVGYVGRDQIIKGFIVKFIKAMEHSWTWKPDYFLKKWNQEESKHNEQESPPVEVVTSRKESVCMAGKFEKYTISDRLQYRHREQWVEYDYNLSWNIINDIEPCLKE